MALDSILSSGGLVVVVMLSSGFALGRFFDLLVTRALAVVVERGRYR